MSDKLLLHAEKIDKKFGPTHAVKEVSLDFYAGEIHALIGENGSGKSTFTNMLTGILPIGSGTFTLDGEQIAPKNQVDGNHHGVAVIVQELGTLNGLTVAENLFLGDERIIGRRTPRNQHDEDCCDNDRGNPFLFHMYEY